MAQNNQDNWDVWEVFVQTKGGEPHQHVGNVHAADAELALQNARDVYGRRASPISMWVMPAAMITATSPDDTEPFFEPGNEKIYRHPQFYKVPRRIK